MHFEREPVGEWIALAATTRLTAGDGALASGTLYDTTGRIGQSEQSLYIGPRAPPTVPHRARRDAPHCVAAAVADRRAVRWRTGPTAVLDSRA